MRHMVGQEIRSKVSYAHSQSDFWWTVGTLALGVLFIGYTIWRLSTPVTN